MQLQAATLAALCLAGHISQATAKMSMRDAIAGSRVAVKRAEVLIHHDRLDRRDAQPDAAPAGTASVSSSPTSMAMAAIPTVSGEPSIADTKAACQSALAILKGVPASVSGMSACYNVAYFDTTTGEFEANLLLYQVGPATGNWSTVNPATMQVGLSYPGADVASGTPNEKRDNRLVIRGSIPLITNLNFVGQVEDSLLSKTNDQYVYPLISTPTLQLTCDSEPQ